MTATSAAPLGQLTLRSLNADWTRARWEELPEDGNRYEVIDGVLYISTSPSAFHQWVSQQAFVQLRERVVLPGFGFVFYAPIGLFMPGAEAVQPDLLVVRAEDRDIIRDRRVQGIPALIVEILSPSSADLDLVIKRAIYAKAGVPELWIFRPAERDVLVHTEPDVVSGAYRRIVQIRPDDELVSPTLPVRFPVATIYDGAPDTTI
jgi:Uma2 family endonuclease